MSVIGKEWEMKLVFGTNPKEAELSCYHVHFKFCYRISSLWEGQFKDKENITELLFSIKGAVLTG